MKNKFDLRKNNSFLLKFSLIVRLKMNKDLGLVYPDDVIKGQSVKDILKDTT